MSFIKAAVTNIAPGGYGGLPPSLPIPTVSSSNTAEDADLVAYPPRPPSMPIFKRDHLIRVAGACRRCGWQLSPYIDSQQIDREKPPVRKVWRLARNEGSGPEGLHR